MILSFLFLFPLKEKERDSDVSNSPSSSPTDKLKPALNRTKARPSNHDPKPQSLHFHFLTPYVQYNGEKNFKHWYNFPHLQLQSYFLHLCSRSQVCPGNVLVGRVKTIKLRPLLLPGPAVSERNWVGKKILSTMRTVQACRPPSAASGGPSASRSKLACV